MKRMGCLGLVIVLLAAGFVYQWWSLEQLRGEVRSMSGKVQVQGGKGKASDGKPDLVTALANTERHAERARELVKQKRLTEVQAELDQALKSLQTAHELSSSIVGDAAEAFGKARENAENVFKKAWKDISKEATSKK